MEKSDRNVWVLAGEISTAVDKTGIERTRIDGSTWRPTGTGAANPFWHRPL
jgi:hypothetical protein